MGGGGERTTPRALEPGDLVLFYVGAPDRVFVGRAVLASGEHDWSPSEAQAYSGVDPAGVLLDQIERWEPPVPMSRVLLHIGPEENARADFEAGIVGITATEYAAALVAAAVPQ